MKRNRLLSCLVVWILSSAAMAENGALVASDTELDVLSTEASKTDMKEVTPTRAIPVEPAVAPPANTDATDTDILSDSVAKQLSIILGAPDADNVTKTEAKLEGMVTSALLGGAKIDDLRTAVSAAMEDLETSNKKQDGFTKKVRQAAMSLDKLVKTDNTPAIDTSDTVTVQPGDSLYKIALRVYGSGSNFLSLYQANTDILSNPNFIRIGQVLRVPR